jgi:cobalt-zinc-cadmium efflux system outer membrane protein
MKMAPIVLCILALRALAHAGDGAPLTLREAVARALAWSPALRAATHEVRARDALALQAGALPNPELRGQVENLGGSGDRQAFEQTESTVLLAQQIELGGKRTARMDAAAHERALAAWDREATRLDVTASTTKAFVTTLAAQRRLELAQNLERLAGEAKAAADRAVAAGAAAPVEAIRMEVALSRARVARLAAERTLAAVRIGLAATWGDPTPVFGRAGGDLSTLPAVPTMAELEARVSASPEVARWAAERASRRAAVALEEARRVPDVILGAGGRHFSDNGDNALVVEVSLPLPIFDRNRGGVLAARERLAGVEDRRGAARTDARAAVAEVHQRLRRSCDEAALLRAELLPAARRSAQVAGDALRQGLLRPLDAIDTRRTLFDVEAQYIDALEACHLAAADAARLTAAPEQRPADGGVR